jgi:response regulator RpfG family c-di-GMP phosphodiesterase
MPLKANIHVIDDNEIILEIISMQLRGNKYHVLSAQSDIDGLKLFYTHHDIIDLVNTDIIMPNICESAMITVIKNKKPTFQSLL